MSGQTAAMLLTILAHIVGLVVLIAVAMRGDDVDWRALVPRDDDEDGGLGVLPIGDEPPGGPSGGRRLRLPLPDAVQSRRRLRGPRPLRLRPGRTRRRGRPDPDRVPDRDPSRPR
ncbi:MAG: hypothetical protein V9E83_01285 [Baekduia sp.]